MIEQSYLLVTNIPCHIDRAGSRFLDPLWHKDLLLHKQYLRNLTVACPAKRINDNSELSLSEIPLSENIDFLDLPFADSMLTGLLTLPLTSVKLGFGVASSSIVHCGIAGWPIPLGWIASPLARIFSRTLLVIVESAPWRAHVGKSNNWKSLVHSAVFERFGKACVHISRLAIFTQPDYMKSFLGENDTRGHVTPASWVDASCILDDCEAGLLWDQKSEESNDCFRILFAGRVVQEKGVGIILEALETLDQYKTKISIDILGDGQLLSECKKAANRNFAFVSVNLIGTVPYGPEFFQLLRRYHAVIIPSLADEQPRIIFDAFSQAVPVVGSNTPGINSCVDHLETGILFEPGNSNAFAMALIELLKAPELLKQYGINCLARARGMTHQAMHDRRYELLKGVIKLD